jgi:two-component system OmpR family sensor kinase
MTLRTRLGVVAALVLVVLLAVGVLLPRIVRSSLIDQVDHQLDAAIPIALELSRDLGTSAADRRPPAATRLSELYVARVPSGPRQLVVAPASLSGREPKVPATSFDFRTAPKPTTVGSVNGSGSWRAVLRRLPDGSSLVIALSLDPVAATIQKLLVAMELAAVAVVLAMVAGGWWLLRLGLRPIAEVTGVADAIASGDRSRRVTQGESRTETGRLARAFNVMLDEQQASEEKLRRFVADASHELRTPVAAIGGFTDLWRQGAIHETQLGDVMRRIGQEATRMRGLVEDLLLLARLDEGRPLAREPVDLAMLASDAVLDASATHPSRNVTVEVSEPIVVLGDEARLRQVVANLVANALVHTELPAKVTVRAERQGDLAVLSVVDDGTGMNAEDASHAFDRFWRGDPARARTGTGLGLAITRSIAEAHGGHASLESGLGTGTTVRVVVPLSSEPLVAGLAEGTGNWSA